MGERETSQLMNNIKVEEIYKQERTYKPTHSRTGLKPTYLEPLEVQ